MGIGGTGKSTIVQQWFDRKTASPNTDVEAALQFSFYEHGDRSFADFLHIAQRALGLPFGGDTVGALLQATRTRRLLLFLDGMERLLREYAVAAPELVEERDPVDLEVTARAIVDLDALRFCLGAASRMHAGRLVFTTRLMPLDLDGAAACARLDIGGLTDEQSVALLRKFEIMGDDAELARAAADFGGHPLTLARLANVLRYDLTAPRDVRRAPRYADDIDLKRRRYNIFVRAFRSTPEPLRKLLLLLAASRSGMPGADLTALAGMADIRVSAEAIRELADEMWITVDAHANVRLHPLARRWLSAQDPDRPATHSHHALLWEPRARAVDITAVARREFATVSDLHPVTELIFHLARAERFEEAWNILDNEVSATLAKFSAHRLRSELLLEFFPSADETKPPLLQDVQAQGSLLNSLANDLAIIGQPSRAVAPLERALSIGRTPQSTAVRLGNLALIRIRIGQLRRADAELTRQRELGEGSGDRTNVLVAMQERARLQAICGRHGEAAKLLAAAQGEMAGILASDDVVFEDLSPIGWPVERKRRYVELGRVAVGEAYACLSLLLDKKDAREAAERAVVSAEAAGEKRSIIRAKSMLGLACIATGNASGGRKVLSDVLATVQASGLGDLEPEIIVGIARSWLNENPGTAADLAAVAEREARWHGNRLQIADALLLHASVARGLDRRHLANQAREMAWCDGPPFFYEFVVTACESLLS